MKSDVLIVYEHRIREIENAALLAVELTKRGYSVRIANIYSPNLYYSEAKVVIVPHLYNNYQLNAFCNNFKHNNQHIIDLQYEQVLNDAGEDGIHNPKGEAVKAHHIAWGKAQADRYIKYGIQPSHIHITGCISMDLYRPEFSDYFKSKNEIGNEFGLDSKLEWVLFISSFAYANRTEEELGQYEKSNPFAREFAAISDKSCEQIATWLKRAAHDNLDKEFIYRPHPAEKNTILFKRIEQECKNFHVIGNYSMRQWAHSCDRIYNWFSTSVVDVYFANKKCFILRPIEIPENLELTILKGAYIITDYDQFIISLNDPEPTFPTSFEAIEYFYGKNDNKLAYIQIADLCTNMINGVISKQEFRYKKREFSFKQLFSNIINGVLFYLCFYIKIPKQIYFLFGRKAKLIGIFMNDVYHIDSEFNEYKSRFANVLNKRNNG